MLANGLVSMREAIDGGYGSRSTLTRRINDGSLPAVKNGRYIFFKQEDLDALFKPARPTEEAAMRELAKAIADSAPKLSAQSKRELAALLMQ